jgi:GntR family transcriptional regulator
MPDPYPLYRQIAEDLRQKIESGELGDRLPTELELREQYDASRNTVRDAVKWLIGRGLAETRPGQGTFVVPKINPFVTMLTGDPSTGESESSAYYLDAVTAQSRLPEVTAPRVEMQAAAGDIGTELQLAEGTEVVSRHQRRRIDGTPWSMQTSFYPKSLVDGKHAIRLNQVGDISEGAVEYLSALGVQQVGYRQRIKVRAPDQEETAFFRLPDDGRIQVIEILLTAFDEPGRPIRLTITVYPADRNQFTANVGKVPPEPQRAHAPPDDAAR